MSEEKSTVSLMQRGQGVVEAAIQKLKEQPGHHPYDDPRRSIEHLESINWATDYAEPGYQTPKAGIAFGNWNITLPFQADDALRKLAYKKSVIARVARVLEHLGFELEWEDEWITCENCYKAVRTSPDSYGWRQSYYHSDDCSCVCAEGVTSDETERQRYLEWLEGSHRRAMTFDLDLAALGYVHNKERFEHGFHPGQDADPKKVAEELKRRGINRFIFELDSVGQFDMDFSFWVHESEQHLMAQLDLSDGVVNGPSVSQAAMRGLQNASLAAASLPDVPGTVKYAQALPDGGGAATLIQGPEFVEHGVKLAEQRIQECLTNTP